MTHPNGRTVLSSYETYLVEIENNIATVKFNRPDKANALNQTAWDEMEAIFNTLDETPEARVIILSGEGKHFCAGIDLTMFMSIQQDEGDEGRKREALRDNVHALQAPVNAIENCRKPVLAAIHRACVGGGVDIITACDMRYCTEDAFFVIQEINIGMTADVGTFPRLQKVMSEGMARELAYTGRRLGSRQALSSGLVNETFATQDDMLKHVREIAAEIASKSPLAVWGSKNILNYGRDHTVPDTLQYLAAWQAGMWHMPEMHTAMSAAQKKQVPDFDDLLPTKDVI